MHSAMSYSKIFAIILAMRHLTVSKCAGIKVFHRNVGITAGPLPMVTHRIQTGVQAKNIVAWATKGVSEKHFWCGAECCD